MLTKDYLDNLHGDTRKFPIFFNQSGIRADNIHFGDQPSVFSGSGIDMVKVREYEAGDEYTMISHVLSDEDRLIIVEREESREVRLLCVVDLSRSMFLRQKAEIAYSTASMIFYSALVSNDIPSGLWGRAGRFEVSQLPNNERGQLRKLLNLLQNSLVDPLSSPERKLTLQNWRSFLPAGSFVFVISDFLGEDNFFMKLLENRFSKYKVIPVVVQDDLEYTFPSINTRGITVPIVDVGSHHGLRLTCTEKACDRIRKENEIRFKNLQKRFEDRNLKYAHISNLDLAQIREKIQRTIG